MIPYKCPKCGKYELYNSTNSHGTSAINYYACYNCDYKGTHEEVYLKNGYSLEITHYKSIFEDVMTVEIPYVKSCSVCRLCNTTENGLGYYNETHICSVDGKIQIKERYEDSDNEVVFDTKLFNFREERHPQCPLKKERKYIGDKVIKKEIIKG